MYSTTSWWRGSAFVSLLLCLVNAAACDYPPDIVPFGSKVETARSRLAGQCVLTAHTIPRFAETNIMSSVELRCDGFEYCSGKRKLVLAFTDSRLDAVRIHDIRDALPIIRKTLLRKYGEPSISTRWVDYFAIGGVSIDIAEGELSFASGAARRRQESAVLAMKDHPVKTRLRRGEWLGDLAALDGRIRNAHVHPFWYRDEQGYLALYYQAQAYVRTARKVDRLIVNGFIEKLVAYLSDGHSYVADKAGRFGLLPYRVEWFADAPFITAAARSNRDLLGARLIAMDHQAIARVRTLIAPFIPVVNTSSFQLQSRDAFTLAGLLYVAGVSKHPDTITLTLQLPDGKTVKRRFDCRYPAREELVNLAELPGIASPLYRQERATAQWFERIGDALYIRYASAVESKAGDIAALGDRVKGVLDGGGIRKVIVDVRGNAGGDSHHNAVLVEALRHAPHLNERGRLFVLTNHNTFSAAVNFAATMEVQTAAVFVGEKAGDRANFAGESGPQALYQLPHSHIALSLSFSEWSATYDDDRRDAVRLDLAVDTSVDDIRFGRDPVLQAALDYPAAPLPVTPIDRAAFSAWIGRYDYNVDKALKIVEDDDGLRMEITESVFSRLRLVADGVAEAELAGLRLRLLPTGALELLQEDRADRILVRLPDARPKPLELLMAGRFDQAESAYRAAYKAHPAALSIRANSLGLLASQLRARYCTQTLYRQLRKIAIALHGPNLPSWDDDDDPREAVLLNEGEGSAE